VDVHSGHFVALIIVHVAFNIKIEMDDQQLRQMGVDPNTFDAEAQPPGDGIWWFFQIFTSLFAVAIPLMQEINRQRAARGKGRVARESPLPGVGLDLPQTFYFRLSRVFSFGLWMPSGMIALVFVTLVFLIRTISLADFL
jgi:hypothetical protein